MSWREKRMVGFDLETTSPEPEEARIVTATLALVGAGLPTEIERYEMNPGVPIPAGATEIHGITDEMAAGWPSAAEVVPVMVARLREFARDYPLVGFNIRYDLTVTDRECRRYGVRPLGSKGLHAIDPLVIDKFTDRYRKGSRKLDAVCARYGAVLEDAHDSDSDAVAACRCAWVLGSKGRVIRREANWHEAQEAAQLRQWWKAVRGDLELLHDAQRQWARMQAESLRQHFLKLANERAQAGDDLNAEELYVKAEGVELEWPLVPFTETTPVKV
jgi:DNA polymerase-3 subunit epsilon